MNENIQSLVSLTVQFQEDIAKFMDKDVLAAAPRARKSLLEIGKLTRTLRAQIQERKVQLKQKAP